MPTPTELARAFKAAIDRQDAAALTRLAKTYHQLYLRMQSKLDSLLLAISQLESPTQGQIMRLAQYKNLLTALETELAKYSAYVEVEIRNTADAAVGMAIKQTEQFLRAAGYTMTRSLPKNAIYSMLGFLQEDSPLWKRIGELAPFNTQKVANALLEAVAFGYNPAKTAKLFENVMGGGLTDAMRMTRTAQLYATREASRAMYVANDDVVTGWMWYSSLDADTCMACAIELGTIHSNDESMDSHYNCFPAGVLVTGPTPVAGTKRDYTGELVTIRTASGIKLSFTPNHPILTRRGWVAGGLLQEGDYVIRSAGRKNTDSAIDIDYNDIPTVIEKIVESFDMVLVEVPTAPEDFHGDGIGSKIHTVFTNGLLGSEVSTAFSEPLIEQNFSMGASIDNSLTSKGGLDQRLIGTSATPNSFMRGSGIGASLFGSFLARLQDISFRVTTNVDTLFEQAITDDISGNAEKFSDSIFGLPIEIELDEIVDINRSVFDGQVYNLQTTHEWYVANSIITHNCRCTSIPVVAGYGDKVQTGADWFNNLSEKQQQDMMGKGAFEAWKDGRFDLSDMVTRRHDDVYGEMLARTPLSELIQK